MIRKTFLAAITLVIASYTMSDCSACQEMAIGFEAADADQSGDVSAEEMKTYLSERLPDEPIPFDKVFDRIDADNDSSISEQEFGTRHEAIEHFLGDEFFGGGMGAPEDPGKDYVPYRSLDKSVHDGKVLGAVMHRFEDLSNDATIKWGELADLDKVPRSVDKPIANAANTNKSSLKNLMDATIVIGGGSGMGFFTAGAVMISDDGLAVTNYHVAEFLSEGRMVGMTTDGKCHPIVKFIAGNPDRDVALIRLQGSGFKHVNVAKSTPRVGDDIEMVHHSENRFFTYDRGYVMRYPTLGDHPWMEISADYAPGGSGCGIYNENHELVGLVSIIQFGDGPSLAENFDPMADEEDWGGDDEGAGMMPPDGAMLLVKHAVPLTAIQSLWKDQLSKSDKRNTPALIKAKKNIDSSIQ